jgi:hypothetical protein
MLCALAKDLEITLGAVAALGTSGSAHWEANYTFSKTGRAVHNVIEASFTFLDDKIVRHVDRFGMDAFDPWNDQKRGAAGAGGFSPKAAVKEKRPCQGYQQGRSRPSYQFGVCRMYVA